MKYVSTSEEETKEIAKKIASKLSGGELLCLYGELGAGKTTFIQGMVHFFNSKIRVLSPTYIIVRHYHLKHLKVEDFYHVDLYRISNIKELNELGLDDIIYKPNSLVAVEWAQKLGEVKSNKRVNIRLEFGREGNRRVIEVSSHVI